MERRKSGSNSSDRRKNDTDGGVREVRGGGALYVAQRSQDPKSGMGEKAEWTAGVRFSLERGGEGLQLLRSVPSYQPGPTPGPPAPSRCCH